MPAVTLMPVSRSAASSSSRLPGSIASTEAAASCVCSKPTLLSFTARSRIPEWRMDQLHTPMSCPRICMAAKVVPQPAAKSLVAFELVAVVANDPLLHPPHAEQVGDADERA